MNIDTFYIHKNCGLGVTIDDINKRYCPKCKKTICHVMVFGRAESISATAIIKKNINKNSSTLLKEAKK